MIAITVPEQKPKEMWDPAREEFFETRYIPETKLSLEHSLISISKWESKWKKAFLKKEEKTAEEMLDYIRCMTIEKNVPDEVYMNIPQSEMKRIVDYLEDPMTATHINKRPNDNKPPSREVITSELVYYWMIANEIPFECEKWHINRLLSLIQVCSVKNQAAYGGKKGGKSTRDLMKHNAALNASRRAKLGSKG